MDLFLWYVLIRFSFNELMQTTWYQTCTNGIQWIWFTYSQSTLMIRAEKHLPKRSRHGIYIWISTPDMGKLFGTHIDSQGRWTTFRFDRFPRVYFNTKESQIGIAHESRIRNETLKCANSNGLHKLQPVPARRDSEVIRVLVPQPDGVGTIERPGDPVLILGVFWSLPSSNRIKKGHNCVVVSKWEKMIQNDISDWWSANHEMFYS